MQVSKANMRPATTLPLARYFSQTSRVAEEAKDQVVEDAAIESTEETGSTVKSDTLLESSQTERERGRDGHSIFISNMTFDATDVHLREAFGKYGDITAINIGRDGRGLSRGFGFITFTTKESADRAVEEVHKSFWHGRRINVEHRKPSSSDGRSEARGQRPQNTTPTNSIYIGNIPYETSDADLNRLFRELDNVTDVRVAVDRNTGWPRGFAHADFTDVESAIKGYEKISSTAIGGRQLRVDYSQRRTSPVGRPRD
ncbi:Uu.00g038610.m01.CDS01 [Anthostomella pinea]|uniref:Uu.00g038610.m01.CDS01 n=1 Tax=Anthostomella pinea TaxID=933095 RepID=A0AAI8V4X2_9PEZI|nr:Uu.00g038610.m01.CDS01 [Anthostomella pinea]